MLFKQGMWGWPAGSSLVSAHVRNSFYTWTSHLCSPCQQLILFQAGWRNNVGNLLIFLPVWVWSQFERTAQFCWEMIYFTITVEYSGGALPSNLFRTQQENSELQDALIIQWQKCSCTLMLHKYTFQVKIFHNKNPISFLLVSGKDCKSWNKSILSRACTCRMWCNEQPQVSCCN